MFFCCQSEQTAEQTLDRPVIRDAMSAIWRRRIVWIDTNITENRPNETAGMGYNIRSPKLILV